jgi:hypothetical protein
VARFPHIFVPNERVISTLWQRHGNKNMPQERKRRVKSKVARSCVTNGKRLFLRVPGDNRSREARRFRDIFDQLCVDLGGFDLLSEFQIQLCRRAAMLSLRLEEMEAASMVGEQVDWVLYGQLTDRFNRVSQRLGVERIARDVTMRPSVKDYIEHINSEPDEATDVN